MPRYVKKTPEQWEKERRLRGEIRAGEARALKVTKTANKIAVKAAAEAAARAILDGATEEAAMKIAAEAAEAAAMEYRRSLAAES